MRDKIQKPGETGFAGLFLQSVPEIWSFQMTSVLPMALPVFFLQQLTEKIADSTGTAVTTADLKSFFLSWRAPAFAFTGILLIAWFIIVEIFANIYMADDILSGRPVSWWGALKRSCAAMRKFLVPSGIGPLIFTFIAVPLCGVGFSISLSATFRIPTFILDVVLNNPFLLAGYAVLILVLIWVAFRSVFIYHGALLDGKQPKDAGKDSRGLVMSHKRILIAGMIGTAALTALFTAASSLLFLDLPDRILTGLGRDLPKGYFVDPETVLNGAASSEDIRVVIYRIACVLVFLLGGCLTVIVHMLCTALVMLQLTKYYRAFRDGKRNCWPVRPKKGGWLRKLIVLLLFLAAFALASVWIGIYYQDLFVREEPVHIIAHRAGGVMASENSLEGIHAAIDAGCYGSEIDVQRTKDGYYVVNHDDTFKRLTGVNKASQNMTLEEIRELRVKDTSGSGKLVSIPTLEEMLDVIKGRETLFIELKGKTADRQMADDLVRMVKEKDCLEDVVMISLKYNVIDYIESTYPEVETGLLFYGGFGNFAKLNCDILIMEEDIATNERIGAIHDKGKQAIVWTVNEPSDMYRYLGGNVDGIITDQVPKAQKVQAAIEDRPDIEVIRDNIAGIFGS